MAANCREVDMSTEINIADITVHLHPESSCDDRDKLEQELRSHDGVVSVHFNGGCHVNSYHSYSECSIRIR